MAKPSGSAILSARMPFHVVAWAGGRSHWLHIRASALSSGCARRSNVKDCNPVDAPAAASISSRSVRSRPPVKQAVRGLDIGDCARFARRVMEQSDPARIRELVAGFAAGAGEKA